MPRPTALSSALSALAAASLLTSCAAPSASGVASAGRLDSSKAGLATQALAALNANDFAAAVTFAEQAVEQSAEDATVRSLLATAYFGAGRFASAETAYSDALSLGSGNPKVVLKLALVQIAQGKAAKAVALLQAARSALDPADYGLALALAGYPHEAISALEPVARSTSADARVRQNLALSHALAGDWIAARAIAAQDVPANQLEARIQQWMKMASPQHASDQVAALTGVTPAASDPGQPVHLALRREGTALAASDPVVEPAPGPVQLTEVPAYVAPALAAAPEPAFRLEPVDAAEQPFVDVKPQSEMAEVAVEPAAPKSAPVPAPKARPSVRPAAFVPKKVASRPAVARKRGKSSAVVQIGAYGSLERVATAWNAAVRRYKALNAYVPVSARFQSSDGPVYRLAVKGFGSPDEAKSLCVTIKRAGGNCFVRNVAGDSPVQMASR